MSLTDLIKRRKNIAYQESEGINLTIYLINGLQDRTFTFKGSKNKYFGLSGENLLIRKEVAARLVAVNIVRMIMLEAAREKGVDPIRISFVHAVRAILMFAPALACEPMWKLPQIYRTMLAEIGTNLVPQRPGRNEPRAVTRERKHYPKLRSTREQWRKAYAA